MDVELYKQRALEAELETKAAHEQNLQNQIQLKTAALSKYSLSLAQKNKLLEEVSGTLQKLSTRKRMDIPTKLHELSNDLNVHLQEEDEWDQFMSLFDEIHPDFTKKLKPNEELTKSGFLAGFSAGFIAVTANPKAALFYLTLLPGFFDFTKIGPQDLAVISVVSFSVPMVGNLLMILFLSRVRNLISSPNSIRVTNIVSGILLIVVGLIIALT